ncbi:MAG TPA: response regulator [Gemmataceae bacterium]|nr:response regulator [Gemmataceae bacterium]
MTAPADDVDTVLIVDDEDSVRRTFREWLEEARINCRILAAADAENALLLANQNAIDLAILDWNLGAGNDGLRLLEDLYVFQPDIVAIMITGYAHQATPLDAMRMGVRDYLDKNQDLDRNTFLAAVKKQLDRIHPAKRERRLHRSLMAFRESVEKILPIVQSAAAIQEPVPLPDAIRSLFGFLQQITKAQAGVLLARSYDAHREPAEISRVYDSTGQPMTVDPAPFARSIAGAVVSRQEPCVMNLESLPADGSVELQPFERGRRSLLAVPMTVNSGIHMVLELFDKSPEGAPFTEEDQRLVAAAANLGSEMLRQALGERQMHRVLFDAVEAALHASDSLADSLSGASAQSQEQPPPRAVLDSLKQGLSTAGSSPGEAEETVKLAEAIRVLALRHGTPAVSHCLTLIQNLRGLLDKVSESS